MRVRDRISARLARSVRDASIRKATYRRAKAISLRQVAISRLMQLLAELRPLVQLGAMRGVASVWASRLLLYSSGNVTGWLSQVVIGSLSGRDLNHQVGEGYCGNVHFADRAVIALGAK